MPRTRSIPDDQVFAVIQRLLQDGGDRAVSFGTVAAATGLAAPTLAQRYATRDGMVRAARAAAWDALDRRTGEALTRTVGKGPQAFLKAIGPVDPVAIAADLRDPDLALRASAWRAVIESALADRIGSGPKARERAALLFAAWTGQMLWTRAGMPSFRIKDAIKRLT
jgi:AcrR family transcriptional regulator